MGKRSWKLKCEKCNTEFWEWFEHMDPNEILDFCDETNCPECKSEKCTFTSKTQFSGGKVTESDKILVECRNCYDEWWLNLADESLLNLKSRARNLRCDNCDESGDPRISDAIPSSYFNIED